MVLRLQALYKDLVRRDVAGREIALKGAPA
jgi:hypothetical protein